MKSGKVKIVLHIYSGRPDPEWELTEQQVEELKDMLKDTPRIGEFGMDNLPGGLGYQGFTIYNQDQREDIPAEVTAFQDNLFITDDLTDTLSGDKVQVNRIYQDTNNLEKWLLKRAKEHGYEEVIKAFSV